MKSIQEIFPRASASFLKANPLSSPSQTPQTQASVKLGGKKRGRMNKTEGEYALILEAMKQKGEIIRYEFEGITLRFAGVRYTPDFYVLCDQSIHPAASQIKYIEIKGRYISGKFERAIERFRHARTYWPEFQFEMHQKTKDGWKQIL
jgi:hypothetical protein